MASLLCSDSDATSAVKSNIWQLHKKKSEAAIISKKKKIEQSIYCALKMPILLSFFIAIFDAITQTQGKNSLNQ